MRAHALVAVALVALAGCGGPFEKDEALGPDGIDETDTGLPPDTTTGGDDTGWPDASGLVSVVGEINWYDVVGGYWDTRDFGDAWLQVAPPADLSIVDFYAPGLDRCASDFSRAAVGEVYDTGADQAVLTGLGGASLRLPWSPDDLRYEDDALHEDQFEAGSAYDLEEIAIDGLPAFSVTEVARTGEPFEVTEPDIMGDTYLLASKDRLAFAWTGSGADYILFRLGLWDETAQTWTETVTCAAADDGSFLVPPEVWTAWTPGVQLDVFVGRAMQGRGTVGFDHSGSAMVGTYWLYGAMQTAE